MRLTVLAMLMSSAALMAQFKPEIAGIEIQHRVLRPGASTLLTVKFVNKGTAPADKEYRAFVHVEDAEKKCEDIHGHHDHELISPPTTYWKPGQIVEDGPINIGTNSNTRPGKYLVHIGIFDTDNGNRLIDSYAAGELTIDPNAPDVKLRAPEILEAKEFAKRKAAADRLLDNAPYVINTPEYRFRLALDGSRYDLLDKRGGALWHSNLLDNAFGYISFKNKDGKPQHIDAAAFDSITQSNGAILLKKTVDPELTVEISISPVSLPLSSLRFAVKCTGKLSKSCAVQILNGTFPCANNENGATVVAYRTGERFDTNRSARPFRRPWTTYCWDSTMAMFGQEKDGCALLIDWNHPHTRYEFNSSWTKNNTQLGTVVNSISLELQPGASECFIRPLGKGSYKEIAKAYRQVATQRGLAKTWASKKQDTGNAVDKMHGAADFKPFVFSRISVDSRYNTTGNEQVNVPYQLDEISQITEHLHDDLGIDKAMMVLAGWVHRGYDNQHPDPLPVAPELGGNDALVAASKRIRDTGFLFGLHDNYQDMYKDAPSWNPDFIGKNPDGSLMQGGNWAGGPCWLVCAEKQLELAMRPDTNLPKIRDLFHPTIYFIDTIFAAPLYSCFDPNHPETHADDMAYKTKLCQYARSQFGLFGSEEGREWAVPYADYMEGIFGHRANIKNQGGRFYSHLGGDLIPLFEMVYGDCVNLYTHQSDRAVPGRDDYIVACISHAENPLYNFGGHLYFKQEPSANALPLQLATPTIEQRGPRQFRITYTWNVTDNIDRKFHTFIHFTHANGDRTHDGIAFQDDHALLQEPKKKGDVITDVRDITIPPGFEQDIAWRIGIFDSESRVRQNFTAPNGEITTNAILGNLSVNNAQQVVYDVNNHEDTRIDMARCDQGWGESHNLIRTDAFIKNTYEVASWVSRLAANTPMTDHRFLNDARNAEYTAFGTLQIWINQSGKPVELKEADVLKASSGKAVVLPNNGFFVLAPDFAAFHALSVGGVEYPSPALFTFRALDNQPLETSKSVRVFHGFGNTQASLYGNRYDVTDEAILTTR